MSPKTILEIIAVGLTILGTIFTAFFWLDERHAQNSVKYELELEMLEYDIKRDNTARVYYENKLDEQGELSKTDARRLQNLEKGLEVKYDQQEMLQEKLMEMGE